GVLYLLGENLRPDVLAEAKSLGELSGMALSNAALYEESQGRVAHIQEQFEELVERVERLRQTQKKRAIEVDGLQIDLAKGEVIVEGKAVSLSPVEFDLLARLAENAGEPLTHDVLLRLVWGLQYEGQPNVVDVSIHRLRRKIEDDPSHPKRIVTVRGVGYMLSTGSQATASGKIPLSSKKVV
ncbi:MAG: winged helix-turn-helix domain-containing protein, partial [Dehalococcoidia bacterium]|nr:winged helix-turn-helix domain-containing protein [Dehalococcoidia bacterium]